MDNITIIIVSYNTPGLLLNCITSIRKFYPTIKIILVDGSPADSDCWALAKQFSTSDENITTFAVEHNISHGGGMKLGIKNCTTDYFLLCDSDVEILKPNVIEYMMFVFEYPTLPIYGVGQVVKVDVNGNNSKKGIPYLHPHFALIKKSEYEKYDPIINHGAPMLKAMMDIDRELGYGGVVNIPTLHTYIKHHERGTRKLNPPEFNPDNWDKV